jgi:hypothetical protein
MDAEKSMKLFGVMLIVYVVFFYPAILLALG